MRHLAVEKHNFYDPYGTLTEESIKKLMMVDTISELDILK